MTTSVDVQDIASAAREMLDGKVQSVTALAQIAQRESDLQAQLRAVQADKARGYAAAIKDGWTDAQLSKLGISKPGTPGRRRTPSRAGAARPADSGAQQ